MAKTLAHQVASFGFHFVDRKCHSQNRVIAGKPAILAVVDALAGNIKRREQAHGPSEKSARDGLGLAG